MDSKRRKISHDYNLRSRNKRTRVLRSRVVLQRNDDDAGHLQRNDDAGHLQRNDDGGHLQRNDDDDARSSSIQQEPSDQAEMQSASNRNAVQEQQQQRKTRSHKRCRKCCSHGKKDKSGHKKDKSGLKKDKSKHRKDRSGHRKNGCLHRKNRSRHQRKSSSSKKPNDDASDDVKCVICLDTVGNRRMKRIACGHSFHAKCCNNWLAVNDACPVCRTVVGRRRSRINDNRERVIDNTPISDIIYFFTLSVVRTIP